MPGFGRWSAGCIPTPLSVWGATAGPPPAGSAFLLENGASYLLLESGDRILLE